MNLYQKPTVPLQFQNLAESVKVMSHLFGRDAGKQIIKDHRTEWQMSLGITVDTKASIKSLIEQYARN